MRSRDARSREAWMLIAGEIGIVAILLMLLAVSEASMGVGTLADFLQAGILLVTGCIVFWYTKETQRLRETAQRQTEITRKIFEASHRPYITVMAQEGKHTNMPRVFAFSVDVMNHGTVPARITLWKVESTLRDQEEHEEPVNPRRETPNPSGKWLAPHSSIVICMHFPLAQGQELRLRGCIKYKSFASLNYCSKFDAKYIGTALADQRTEMIK